MYPWSLSRQLARRRRETRQRMERAGKELRRLYHRRILEVLMRATKVALEALRKRLSWVEKGTCEYKPQGTKISAGRSVLFVCT